jgi:hypothetical protein
MAEEALTAEEEALDSYFQGVAQGRERQELLAQERSLFVSMILKMW